ncbi:nucleic acid binding [Blomia tropicalis]|nr:nucleic acid binding [Blomia tropicalis]
MPRYDDSPRGHSPMDRRDRRIKSPLLDRRRRDSPPLPPPRMSSRDHLLYHHDDYRSSHHSSRSSDLGSTTYKILCVSNISNKYPDSTVRNELLKEFTRFGEPSVKLVYDKNTRLAYLYFGSYEDAREARHAKSRLILFDKPVIIDPIYDRVSISRKRSISPDYGRSSLRNMSPPMRRAPPPPPPRSSLTHDRYQLSHSRDTYNHDIHSHQLSSRSSDSYQHSSSSLSLRSQHQPQTQTQPRESKKEKFPNYLHHIPPEEDDKSTRTLFVGNLEVTITEPDLRRIFERYGVVEDVDFLNLDMAHRAKVEMSGQYIGKFQCKIGYGKATPTTRIWVGGLGPWSSFAQLDKEFDRFGAIRKIDFVKGDNHAYIQYDTIDAAQAACAAMRGYPLGGADKRLRIDYADPGPFSTSPRPATEAGTFNFNNSPSSAPTANNNGNNNNNNFEFWRGGSDNTSSPKRRRVQSPDGGDADRKRSPNNVSGFDSLTSPREGNRESSPNFEIANGKSEIKITINENVTSIPELIKCCAPTWTGGLILKSSGFATRMYFCNGDIQLVDLMKDATATEHSMLRITQRLRLEASKLDDVSRRINTSGSSGHCIMIASQAPIQLNFNNNNNANNSANTSANNNDNNNSNGNNGEDNVSGGNLQQRPMRNLVTYLKSKDAAGVVLLSGKSSSSVFGDQQQQQQNPEVSKGVLYLFPPHTFSVELIQKIAPSINADSANREDYLVVVLVRGSN